MANRAYFVGHFWQSLAALALAGLALIIWWGVANV